MRNILHKENFENKELVFAIIEHPVLGWIIDAFAVTRNARGQFDYDFRKVARNTVWDYFDTLNPAEQRIIDLIDKYSDENLQKRFGRAKTRTRDFFEKLEQDFINTHIRPFLERRIYEIVTAMPELGLKLHYKGDAGERIREIPLTVHAEKALTCFHFEKQENQTLYRLEVVHRGRELQLFNSQARLISQKPCVLLLNKEVFYFEPEWDGQKFKPFLLKPHLETPACREKEFYEKFVQKSIATHPFKALGFEVKQFENAPVPVLRLEEHWQGSIMLGLYFYYGKVVFHAGESGQSRIKFVHNWPQFHFEQVVRDTPSENRAIALLKAQGLKRHDGPFFAIPEEEEASCTSGPETQKLELHACLDWLGGQIGWLTENGFQLEMVLAKKRYFTGDVDLSFQTREQNDWFDLNGVVKFGVFEISFALLRDNILKGNREYALPDGSIALIPEEWMATYHDLLVFAKPRGETLELKKHHFSLLQSIPQQGLQLPDFQARRHDDVYAFPSGLQASLRPYQQEGYHWMMHLRENKLGGCLADDMGLGKTLQALALLSRVHLDEAPQESAVSSIDVHEKMSVESLQMKLFEAAEQNISRPPTGKPSLIVMPLSLIHNWTEEARRFAPGLKILQHTGVQRSQDVSRFYRYHIVLTTYGTVRNDIEMLSAFSFQYVILDESQVIKNATSRIFSAIRRLQCQHRLVLSGTPIENSLTDLWSQFSFINPGMLGSPGFFREEFVSPIEKKSDKQVSLKLQKLIEPFILRRTKEQVARELPELTEKIYYCEMTPEQQSYYESRKSEIRNAIIQGIESRGIDKSRFLVLSGLTRLRLVANHPGIVDPEYTDESGKYNEIIRNVEKLLEENHKVLIFSQFVKHLNLFRDYFSQKQYRHSMLTGSIPEKDRKHIISSFQNDPDNRLFLISLKAGGVGLNLTGADYVFMLDPWWNPAVENQAINRAHRIGQDKNVFVYKFITRNTVEEKIVRLQERKMQLAGLFINENNPLKSLSIEELQELI